jgi:hypothetical protein
MSILGMLADYDGERARVVSFELSEDLSTVRVEECCDNYFYADLTKDEFGQMIAELQLIHEKMAA